MTSKAFLLLGSNLGDREEIIAKAIIEIGIQIGDISIKSSIYETLAWGIEDQPAFLNQVVTVASSKKPDELLSTVNKIEKELGRVRHEKWGERLIDIDILYFDNLVINTMDLKIPHPEIINRRFTLVPLAEIAPDFVHPVLEKTQSELLESCEDGLEVKRYN